ncbi:MAG: fumarylacetoacetate hydrolase family protein [Firmicutes bacterium]|nr:fumarylacetoacetate hydrolase family protein [Bacillota bacterium]
MKVFQFYREEQVKLGLVLDRKHIDAEATVMRGDVHAEDLPTTLSALIQYKGEYGALAARYDSLKPVCLREEEIRFAPAVTEPEKIICVGLNYMAHRQETGETKELAFPPLFCKYRNSLAAHGQAIQIPPGAKEMDYEVELVIVMGKRASRVKAEEALDYVFGYTAGNDVSARDLQFQTGQWLMGKACDGFAPVGPYLVTADELSPEHLDIMCKVNGQVCQASNTSYMLFSCAELISHISNYITLEPGDILFTGTPEGVILGRPEGERVWLKSGDRMEVTVEKIGTLTNTIA